MELWKDQQNLGSWKLMRELLSCGTFLSNFIKICRAICHLRDESYRGTNIHTYTKTIRKTSLKNKTLKLIFYVL